MMSASATGLDGCGSDAPVTFVLGVYTFTPSTVKCQSSKVAVTLALLRFASHGNQSHPPIVALSFRVDRMCRSGTDSWRIGGSTWVQLEYESDLFVLLLVCVALIPVGGHISEAATRKLNVVILMSDDQRWDMVTPTFTPHIWDRLIDRPASGRFPHATSVAFKNSFVSNPQCCPSRTSTLTGNYSHTTGVWDNEAPTADSRFRRQEQHRGRFQPRGLSHGDDRQVSERLRCWARLVLAGISGSLPRPATTTTTASRRMTGCSISVPISRTTSLAS